MAGASGGRWVPLAEGSSRAELAEVSALLERAQIRFRAEEQPGGGLGGDWQWRLHVPAADAGRAHLLLTRLAGGPAGEEEAASQRRAPQPSGTTQIRPGPLFESRGLDRMRVLLMLSLFGLAVWLLLH